MTYLIQISEEQRLALIEVISQADRKYHKRSSNEDTPLEYWIEMLLDLPKNERENPRNINGFCL